MKQVSDDPIGRHIEDGRDGVLVDGDMTLELCIPSVLNGSGDPNRHIEGREMVRPVARPGGRRDPAFLDGAAGGADRPVDEAEPLPR